MKPQLATAMTLDKLKTWPFERWANHLVEVKYDGLRCVWVRGKPYSRTGKPLYNLGPAEKELTTIPNYRNRVFDSEAVGNSWEETMSVIQSSVTKKAIGNVTINMFDKLTLREWERRYCDTRLEIRKEELRTLCFQDGVSYQYIRNVTTGYCGHINNFRRCLDASVRDGYEGLMLKDLYSTYHFTRDQTWLKVKLVKEMDCRIIGFKEGRGKYQGMLGALIVQQPNGMEARVGGMNDSLRVKMWVDRSKYMNHIVECKYTKLTPQGIMYAPRFHRMRWDKE